MSTGIHALPDELLTLVLLEWFRSAELPQDEWHRYKSNYGAGWHRRLLRVPVYSAAVCRRWRAVALQTPWIWRHIWLDLNCPLRRELLETVADRSGALPLRVVLDNAGCSLTPTNISGDSPPYRGNTPYGSPPYGSPPYGSPPYGTPPYDSPPYDSSWDDSTEPCWDSPYCDDEGAPLVHDEGAQDLWPLVHRIVGRAETLVVTSFYKRWAPDPELFAALAQPNAALVNFDLTVESEPGPPYPSPPSILSLSAPRLRCLRWTGPDLLLGDLHAEFPSLQKAVVRCEVLRASQLRGWFAHMPNLQSLNLSGVKPAVVQDVPEHYWPRRGVALSTSLRELVICNKFVAALSALVAAVKTPFPALRTLKVIRPHLLADPALPVLIRQCSESLETVDLEVHLDVYIQSALASLRAVRTLRLLASDETLDYVSSHARSLVAHCFEEIAVFGVAPRFYHRLEAVMRCISEISRDSGSPRSLRLVDEYADKGVVRILADRERVNMNGPW